MHNVVPTNYWHQNLHNEVFRKCTRFSAILYVPSRTHDVMLATRWPRVGGSFNCFAMVMLVVNNTTGIARQSSGEMASSGSRKGWSSSGREHL